MNYNTLSLVDISDAAWSIETEYGRAGYIMGNGRAFDFSPWAVARNVITSTGKVCIDSVAKQRPKAMEHKTHKPKQIQLIVRRRYVTRGSFMDATLE